MRTYETASNFNDLQGEVKAILETLRTEYYTTVIRHIQHSHLGQGQHVQYNFYTLDAL